MIAFSTTDRNSFDAVASWKHKVEAEVGSIPMALVQNKVRRAPPPLCWGLDYSAAMVAIVTRWMELDEA